MKSKTPFGCDAPGLHPVTCRFLSILLLFLCLTATNAFSQAPTVATLQATGTGIKWYSAPTGGTPLSTSTVLVNGQHYYASQTINGVESLTRLDVVANLTDPSVPAAATHTVSKTQIIWNWASAAHATGYKWSATNNYATATDMAAAVSKTETGLTCETAYTRYVWSYNDCGHSAALTLTQTSGSCWGCGESKTISHVASGGVAPVDKSVTYGTVTGIAGEASKCWITRNLGAAQQAATVDDATEASAGWYWQFNRKQGYKHDGTNQTPTGWDNSDDPGLTSWEASKDPCALELGGTWRIPTETEYSNIDASNNWTDWTGPFSSDLKLHAGGALYAGFKYYSGSQGWFWTSTCTSSTNAKLFAISNTTSYAGNTLKRYGSALRCIRD